MGQALRPSGVAIVVEDDRDQADLVGVLLEESEFEVIEVASAEDALDILLERGDEVSLVFTDVWFDRSADGVALAVAISRRWPWIKLIVSSGDPGESVRDLPSSATYMQKPLRALDILVEAERASRPDRLN